MQTQSITPQGGADILPPVKVPKKVRRAIRNATIQAYGGVCACCGESKPDFLTVDHVHGKGNQQRRELGINGGWRFYRWLRQQGFPKADFQLMCANCHQAEASFGSCPHKREAPKETDKPAAPANNENDNERGRCFMCDTPIQPNGECACDKADGKEVRDDA